MCSLRQASGKEINLKASREKLYEYNLFVSFLENMVAVLLYGCVVFVVACSLWELFGHRIRRGGSKCC